MWCGTIWRRSPPVPERTGLERTGLERTALERPSLERTGFVSVLVDFASELRSAGLAVGSGDILLFCSALSQLDPSDLLDLYWAERSTLVTRRQTVSVHDAAARRFVLG